MSRDAGRRLVLKPTLASERLDPELAERGDGPLGSVAGSARVDRVGRTQRMAAFQDQVAGEQAVLVGVPPKILGGLLDRLRDFTATVKYSRPAVFP